MSTSSRKRPASGAAKQSSAKRRAVARYGAAAVAKYYDPAYVVRTGRYAKSDELKFFDTALSFTIDATGEVPATGQLVLIPQGVTESTRVGRKCCIKSIQLTGVQVFLPSTAANASTNTYIYVVLDKQANGAAAAVTTVFTGTNLAQAVRNMANSERFVILKIMRMNFTATAGVTTAYNSISKPFNWYKRCSIPIEYDSTSGAITEIRSNNIFLIAGSDGQSDDLVTLAGVCRVTFSDGSG